MAWFLAFTFFTSVLLLVADLVYPAFFTSLFGKLLSRVAFMIILCLVCTVSFILYISIGLRQYFVITNNSRVNFHVVLQDDKSGLYVTNLAGFTLSQCSISLATNSDTYNYKRNGFVISRKETVYAPWNNFENTHGAHVVLAYKEPLSGELVCHLNGEQKQQKFSIMSMR